MISNPLLRSSLTLSRTGYYQLVPLLARFASTQSKDVSTSSNKSSKVGKANSDYLAADMYDYTPFSYYEMEASMTKQRLPQPSSYVPLKPPPPPPKK